MQRYIHTCAYIYIYIHIYVYSTQALVSPRVLGAFVAAGQRLHWAGRLQVRVGVLPIPPATYRAGVSIV